MLQLDVHVTHPPGSALSALMMCRTDVREERAAIDRLQREVLEAVAVGRSLREVMDLLCRCVEALAPEVSCSVLTIDEAGLIHPLAAPSLPASYSAALEGVQIGPSAGSCGTAAWRHESVEVTDIATDPLWAPYRSLALAHDLRACWSTPIVLAHDRVVATFALYYREPRAAAPFHRRMVDACTQLCQIAFMHQAHQREIERLAYVDGVTGLPNRTLLTDRAGQMLLLAARAREPAALLLLDMDRFKTVNDSLGHAAGDEVLRQIAQRLLGTLRDSDTLARLGGDEFVVLLPGCTAEDGLQVADKLREALQAPLTLENGRLRLPMTASIGVCAYPLDGGDLDQLLKNADIAMYEAKRAGRDCARYFLNTMNQALDQRLEIETALRHALACNALQLHYQPKLSLPENQLVGVEALLRWKDEQRGWIPPDRFIPVAEESGLIGALDAWVMEQACAQLARWRAEGVDVPSMSVNVSPLRFHQDDVAAHASSLLVRHGLSAGDLTLEVTERVMLDDDSRPREQLQKLHAMGVGVSVDDFGTGYSSLSYLKRLPVTEIKLDKSFVRDLELDQDDRALASAVIGIGRALGMTVVAEGVETDGQRQLLQHMGCDVAQGYFFARPQAAPDLVAWVTARRAQPTG
ncbi:putative bifunctional diguanylate cyclase/phosphodiesterase [Roseateles amylovorans]|uniref:EAL domain-containing protein n=1 Tax=Roseateles amylovorans TaxID=2978473 RepID=A0ABY6B443_9BURK|nr:EAL domain-containing protein [Roseateles amylovorans]UXH79959.1 EAL domain-containing protein [Roseateles amylovorans]